jgi:putative ABC transport system permease protein
MFSIQRVFGMVDRLVAELKKYSCAVWNHAPFVSSRKFEIMLGHLLRLAWRNIWRNLTYSVVTVTGLALGICACICIYVIVQFEFSFDSFHADGKRIYRVLGQLTWPSGEKERYMVLPPAVLRYGRSSLAGAEAVAGIIANPVKTVSAGESRMTAGGVAIADGSYFDIFPYEWLAGDRHRALDKPFTVVLTLARARQYFGPGLPEDYLGRRLVYDDSLAITVSGIIRDWDRNTDLPFTDFLSYPTIASSFLAANYSTDEWSRPSMTVRIWVKLANGSRPKTVDAELAELMRTHAGPHVPLALSLQPLSEMHFDSQIIENPIRTAYRPTLYGLIVIALAILVLAIVNFVNLSTAYSLHRIKEVGVRKVLGSSRTGLVIQFLSESFLLILLAAGVAILLVDPVLATFGAYLPAGVHFDLFSRSTAAFLAAILAVTTLFAGLYPARVASAYLPVAQLRGHNGMKAGERWLLRRGLIVLQFTVALVFITGSVIIGRQLQFVQNKDLGFTANAIIQIGFPHGDSLSRVKIMEELLRSVPGVGDVTRQWVAPMTDNSRRMFLSFDRNDVQDIAVTQVDGDEHYIPLYGMRLLAGRNLFAADSVTEVVINESLARKIGCERPDRALGKMLYWGHRSYPIVGVVADFHTRSLHDPITPVCIINRGDREFNLAVKLASKGQDAGMVKGALTRMARVWRKIYPAGTWNYRFYDETLALLYEKDRRTGTLVNVALGLSIFISCMGLFGLTLFTVRKRSREISIRKVLGASVVNVLTLLFKEMVWLVGIALLVATPIAWWLMNEWLKGFAFRVEIGVWVFLLAGVLAVGVSLVTMVGLANDGVR